MQTAIVVEELLDGRRGAVGGCEPMLAVRITADEAFKLLRWAARTLNTKLREVAQCMVNTGDVPHAPE